MTTRVHNNTVGRLGNTDRKVGKHKFQKIYQMQVLQSEMTNDKTDRPSEAKGQECPQRDRGEFESVTGDQHPSADALGDAQFSSRLYCASSC